MSWHDLMTETGLGVTLCWIGLLLTVAYLIRALTRQATPAPTRQETPAMAEWAGRYAQRITSLTLSYYGRTCHLCLQPGATSADHVVPRSAGGSDAIENLRPAHRLCNSRRGDRSIEWFRQRYCPHLLHPEQPTEQWGFFDS